MTPKASRAVTAAVDRLVKRAKEQGYVVADDVADVLTDDEALDDELVEAIYIQLADEGVELRETAEDDDPIPAVALANDRGRRLVPLDATLGDSDDTISLYLREIGSIPLLTADDERESGSMLREGSGGRRTAARSRGVRRSGCRRDQRPAAPGARG